MARAKGAAIATAAASIMIFSLGIAVPSGGASTTIVSASPSAFCKTIASFHPKTPAGTSLKSYQAWAKIDLPFFQKLASTAPNTKSKKAFNQLVSMIQHISSSSSVSAFGAYIKANRSTWANGWKSIGLAMVGCVRSLY